MNYLDSHNETITLPDAKTQLKKRIAFAIISTILFACFFGVRQLPSHESTHTFVTESTLSTFK